jgi:UDP-N-acetylmuramoyl-tripeptide--D-alanyl-D-alanine ligase
VLGEMRELGASAAGEHEAVGSLAASLGVDLLVVVGEPARGIHQAAVAAVGGDGECVWVPDVDAAIAAVEGVVRPGDILLVKASRAVGLERVAEALLMTAREREAGG